MTGGTARRPPVKKVHRVAIVPTTGLGWWAVGLGAAFFPLVLAWSLTPGGALLGFACGIAGGVTALVAILRRGERAITVFAVLVPLAMVAAFLVGELVVPH